MKLVITKNTLQDLSVSQKKTDIEISAILGVRRAAVTVARNRYGISKTQEWERKDLPTLTAEQISLLDGSILGDGGIEVRHTDSCVLSFGHSKKQHEYALLKAKMLGEYMSKVSTDKEGFTRVRSIVHPVFSEYRRQNYGVLNGKNYKRISNEVLERLNSLSLAIWYCDDGSRSRNQVWFCIGCPSEEERQNALETLQTTFGIKCSICKMSNEECWRLYVWKKSQLDFFDIVSDFVNLAVSYKVPEWYNARNANQQPSQTGNRLEGSETVDKANDEIIYAGKVQPMFGNIMGMPSTFHGEDTVRTATISKESLTVAEMSTATL